MSLLYPDTVTVYNRLGGEGRAVSWQRTVLTEAARVFDPIGTVRAPVSYTHLTLPTKA